ncbi:acyltransferase family protein [Streptomyces sp. C10-9-1]|uniref:acyltransferase family protein n=1 Tax=Streptomyces sp. C10-9-1 TaxID=1859285 RepID=UPI003D75D966
MTHDLRPAPVEPSRTERSDRPDSAAATPPATRRDPFFDNAKYLAIVLVAVAHAWAPFRDDSRAAEALYMTVYAFHMPAFILVSGYLSRGFAMRPHQLKRLVTGVVVPYVIFETAYSLHRAWSEDDPTPTISLMNPMYIMWFLVALFIWRLTTPLWKLVRWPVPIALGVSVLASVSPSISTDLELQRVLQFLPFFVIGLHLKPEHFRIVRRREARLLAVPVTLCALVIAYWAVPRVDREWLFHRSSAQEIGVSWWVGILVFLALFACSLLLTACFLALTPGRELWFTALGTATMYGYLLHGFLAKSAVYEGWYDAWGGWPREPLGMVFVTLVAATAVTVLCTSPVRRVFRFAVEPSVEWVFRRETARPERERSTS